MNEKQRWLLRDLDAWEKRQREHVGYYGPKTEKAKEPAAIRAARRTIALHERTVRWYEQKQKAAWQKQRDQISAEYQRVKRIILFEKTELAVKALTLVEKKEAGA